MSINSNAQFAPLSERVLTVREAAGFLKIGRVTLYKLISKGELKPFKVGARTLFRGAELVRFINAAQKRA